MGERRENNKRETRQRISDLATKMFCERGFEAVTLDEIAVAARVSKMTVFNYFARKEDLMLDRGEDLLLLPFRVALRERPRGQAPIEALRHLVHERRAHESPFAGLNRLSVVWWRVVAASPALKARLHELEDEAAAGLAIELSGGKPDGVARLMAVMIVLTVRTAREEAIQILARGGSTKKAQTALSALLESGFDAVQQLDPRPARRRSGPAAR
jgi:AcrR family transcriptional regulator